MVPIVNCGTSFYAGFVVFSAIGFTAFIMIFFIFHLQRCCDGSHSELWYKFLCWLCGVFCDRVHGVHNDILHFSLAEML